MHPSASPNYYGQPTSDGQFGLVGRFHQLIEVHLGSCHLPLATQQNRMGRYYLVGDPATLHPHLAL